MLDLMWESLTRLDCLGQEKRKAWEPVQSTTPTSDIRIRDGSISSDYSCDGTGVLKAAYVVGL